MNIILGKLAFKEWEEKMKNMNIEYKKIYTIQYNMMVYSYICKKCSVLHSRSAINQSYPIDGRLELYGICSLANRICSECVPKKFIRYPKNY